MVERQLPKLYVEGSIPFARSIIFADPLRTTLDRGSDKLENKPNPKGPMKSLFDNTLAKETAAQLVTPVQRVMIAALIGIVFFIGLGFWASRGSVVFTELVDLALAWCI